MARSPHVRTKRVVPYYPRQLVYLEVWPRAATAPPAEPGSQHHPTTSYDILHHWRAARWECNPSGYHTVRRYASAVASVWWDWLWTQTSWDTEPWVFCWGLGSALTLLGAWQRCVVRELVVDAAVIEDPPTLLSVTFRGRRFKMVDIRNYWPVDLLKLTGSERPGPDLEEQLVRCVQGWPGSSLAPWRATAGGLAWADYEAEPGMEVARPHKCVEARAMERAAYKPGRQEVFYVGDVHDPVYKLDANSHYGAVMAADPLPVQLLGCATRDCTVAELDAAGAHCAVAYVGVHATKRPLPVRRGRQLWHCLGRFRTVLAGRELALACRDGSVEDIFSYSLYRLEPFLSGYASHWFGKRWEAREAGDSTNQLLAKMCINALPGKFARRKPEWQDRPDVVPPVPFGEYGVWSDREKKVKRWRAVGWLAQEQLERGEDPDACPAVSAFIAAAGRVRLQEWIDIAGQENVYYCHTDSVHVNRDGYTRLAAAGHCSPTRLGALKCQGTSPGATYLGCLWYQFAGEWVRCGVPYRHRDVGAGQVQFRSLPSLRTLLQTAHPEEIPVREVQLSAARDQVRGTLGPDGRVSPLVLAGSEELAPEYVALDRLLGIRSDT